MTGSADAPRRVYVPVTWADLGGVRAAGGLAAGTEGYAATEALAAALGLPPPSTAGRDALEDLLEAAAGAAADASFLLLLARVESGVGPGEGSGAAPEGPRRAVLAVDVAVTGPVVGEDAAHPAAVRLAAAVAWSRVAAVLADDPADVSAVEEALRVAGERGEDAALELLEDVALGWFAPSEVP